MSSNDGYLLLALFLIPLGSAVLLILVPSRERGAIMAITGAASLAMFIISVYVFVNFDYHGAQFQGVMAWTWMENIGFLGEKGIQLKVGVDGIAAPMVLLTGIIILAGTWVSWKIQHRQKDFFILLFILVAGVYGTFVTLDLFFFFLLYETSLLPMYLLIAVWGSTRKEYGAMKLMMMLLAASILIFTGIFAIFNEAGLGTFDLTRLFGAHYDPTMQKIFFPMIAIGCGTLGGLFPFHAWSPDGHAAAPTSVSMLHAGVLMKVGAFGIIRLGFQILPEGAHFWAPGLIAVGITAALYGAISALRQTDLKLMTGFSSVSHMGFVFLGLGTFNVIGMSGAVLQMFAHGVMTALFFLLIGGLYDQSHNRDIPNFSGMAKQMPVWTSFFIIAGLASLGLPGLSGFVAELHIFVGVFRAYPLVGGLAVLTAAITLTYLTRMFAQAFFGEMNPRWTGLKEITWIERAGATVLVIAILTLGLWPSPWIDRISTTLAQTIPGGVDVSDLNFDYSLLVPEYILAATAGIVLLADAFRHELKLSRGLLPGIAAAGALAAGVMSLFYVNHTDNFAGLVAIDNYTTFFRVLFAATLLVVIIGSYEFVSREIRHQGEFYMMLILMTLGASFLASAQELLTAYIGVELLSFSAYVAVSLQKHDVRSGEAGLKYVLLGGVASAILLYGLSLIYGSAGSTSYADIGTAFAQGTANVELPMILGLVMLIAGLGFKASAVPFHMWTPDAYEGAPLPITAMLSTVSKAGAFALFLRLFAGPLLPVIHDWQWMIAVIALLTMVVGNLVAIQQHNIKRLLAYSSIGQVGFMLMAIATVSDASASALMLHMGGYLITNLAVFMAVIAFYNHSGTEEISGLRGLAETNPYLAMVITAGLFSLSGMPLLAGFTTKFILFQAAAAGGYLWLVTIAVIMSTVSLYYYLQVIRQMYVFEPEGQPEATSQTVHDDRPELRWRVSPASYLTTGALFIAIIFVGIYATPLLTAADRAAAVLFPA